MSVVIWQTTLLGALFSSRFMRDGGPRIDHMWRYIYPKGLQPFLLLETDRPSAVEGLKSSGPVIVLVIIMATGIASALYLHSTDEYALTYYGDAVSHLVGARKLFDWSENPGWSQIGTVWLPLPHFLQMFPSFVDVLFFSGFAGTAISLPANALTSVFIYKMVLLVLGKFRFNRGMIPIYAAFTAALLYGLNPNIMYLGITAMTEAPFMLFFVGGAYFLFRWRESQMENMSVGRLRFLVISSSFIIAATLCRYEGWFLPAFLIAFSIIITTLALRRKSNMQNASEKSIARRPFFAALILTGLASMLSISGIVFWFVYNAVIYGDALEFANAEYYSAASQALNRNFRDVLFLQPTSVGTVYGLTLLLTYGPVILAAAGLGYFLYRRSRKDLSWGVGFLYGFLVLPPLFTITTLLIGIGEMAYWFNSRFVVLLAPALFLSVGYYVICQPKRILADRRLLVAVISCLFVFYPVVLGFSAVITMADAYGGFAYKHSPYAVAVGEKLRSFYDGTGSIMVVTGSAQEHRILLSSGIAFSNFDTIIESSTWKPSFREPWNHGNDIVIIAKDPDSDGVAVVKYWNEHRGELEKHYQLAFENEYYFVWMVAK